MTNYSFWCSFYKKYPAELRGILFAGLIITINMVI